MLNYNFTLQEVGVYPSLADYDNVIKRVVWYIIFSDTELEDEQISVYLETTLDTDDLENFVEIQNLTKEQILQWAFEVQGGQVYIDKMIPFAQSKLDKLKIKNQTVEYDISLLQ